MPARAHDGADGQRRRRSLRPPGRRRLRRDERLQRLRAAPVSGPVHRFAPCRRGGGGLTRAARGGRSRGRDAGPERPLLLARHVAARLRPQPRPRRLRAVLGEDRGLRSARLPRALVDAGLRPRELPRQPGRAGCAASPPSHHALPARDGSSGRPLRAARHVGNPGRGDGDLQARQPAARDHVPDLVGRRLGLPVSGSPGADPGAPRHVRRREARVGLGHAERRALLHLQAVRRLRPPPLRVPDRRGEGSHPGRQRGRTRRSRGLRSHLVPTRIGIDIGGTFTDLVFMSPDGRVERAKVLSTPDDYSCGIATALEQTLAAGRLRIEDIVQIMHGTTVATNAIVEGEGARVALITTRGFRDALEIGRLRMPVLYDIRWRKPPALVPRRLRFEVAERIDHAGTVEHGLDETDALAVIQCALAERVDAIAVCLLNAYANGVHERRLRELIRALDANIPVTLSSELLPEIKEYERTSTTAVNAYILPVVKRYLNGLESRLAGRGIAQPLTIMQSSGGAMSAAAAAERPIHIIESGPAAGVVGAAELARRFGDLSLLSFDMGGTTAKAALVDRGQYLRVGALEVGGGINIAGRLLGGGGYHVRAPAIDIAEVGAGGGSLVRLDGGGGLVVGPESAGAAPGPACYGRGGLLPTVTDADAVLGFINPAAVAGGGLWTSCG